MKSQSKPVLSLTGVSKNFGKTIGLCDVSFEAAAGEFVVLLGVNGAGKTTLVQLLTGLFPPDEGQIMVAGHDLAHDPVAALISIGAVFQQQTLDLELTVQANLRFQAGLHGLPARQAAERAEELLAYFGLLGQRRARVRTLSGGNRRRLEVARALLHRPRILIMDEATVGLDPTARQSLLDHILALRRDGVLVLWTTHLLDEAERADRVLFLESGRLVFDGTAESAGAASVAEAFFTRTGRNETDGRD